MHNTKLLQIKRCVLCDNYILSDHVLEKLEDGDFELRDIEISISNGSITASQRDDVRSSIGNKKYTIAGLDHAGFAFETVGKLIAGEEEVIYFFITAYHMRYN